MKLELTVPSMACSACVDTISKAIAGVDPAAKVDADTKTKRVAIETDAAEAAVKQAIEGAGYPVN